jgi:hypothetical protein
MPGWVPASIHGMTRTQRSRSLLLVSVASCVLASMTWTPAVHGAAPAAQKVLPFIQDDYPAALAKARELELPLFIEAWAPW